jgi:hypothetical protein
VGCITQGPDREMWCFCRGGGSLAPAKNPKGTGSPKKCWSTKKIRHEPKKRPSICARNGRINYAIDGGNEDGGGDERAAQTTPPNGELMFPTK